MGVLANGMSVFWVVGSSLGVLCNYCGVYVAKICCM